MGSRVGCGTAAGYDYLRTTPTYALDTEDRMIRRLGLCLIALAILSCRSYRLRVPRSPTKDGLVAAGSVRQVRP